MGFGAHWAGRLFERRIGRFGGAEAADSALSVSKQTGRFGPEPVTDAAPNWPNRPVRRAELEPLRPVRARKRPVLGCHTGRFGAAPAHERRESGPF